MHLLLWPVYPRPLVNLLPHIQTFNVALQCKSIISLAAQPKKQKSIAMPKQTWLWWVHVRWSASLQWALSRGIFKGHFQCLHLVLSCFGMPPLSNLLLQHTIISLPFTSIPAPIAFKRKPVISVSHTLVLKQPHPFVCLYLQISQPLSVSLKHLFKYQSAPWCRTWVQITAFWVPVRTQSPPC